MLDHQWPQAVPCAVDFDQSWEHLYFNVYQCSQFELEVERINRIARLVAPQVTATVDEWVLFRKLIRKHIASIVMVLFTRAGRATLSLVGESTSTNTTWVFTILGTESSLITNKQSLFSSISYVYTCKYISTLLENSCIFAVDFYACWYTT